MAGWANPYGFRQRGEQDLRWAPTHVFDRRNPFANITDAERLYFRDNPQVALSAWADAFADPNSAFGRFVNLRKPQMLGEMQQLAMKFPRAGVITDWLGDAPEGWGPGGQAWEGPTRERMMREFRQQSEAQRGEESWAVRRGGWG